MNPLQHRFNPQVNKIAVSLIRQFDERVSSIPDILKLTLGEPDFDTPWHIRDEGMYSLEKGRTFYTSNAGLKELKIEIAKNYNINLVFFGENSMFEYGSSEKLDIFHKNSTDSTKIIFMC